jgi:branched-chain amino acid transport system substrate-binding protein
LKTNNPTPKKRRKNMKRNWTRLFIFLALVACLGFVATVHAADQLKFGALATLEGPFTVMGEDSLRGVKLALKQWNNAVAGKKIELITMSSDASPDSAIRAARKLVEQDKVDLIGPLSGSRVPC